MQKELIDILYVEDDPCDCRLVKLALSKSRQPVKFTLETAGSLAECREQLKNNSFDLVLLDLGLPDSYGLVTIDRICEVWPHIPVVVLTGIANEEMGVEAIKRGASDYLVKSKFSRDLLVRTIRYALERKWAEERQAELLKKVESINKELKDFAYIVSHDLKAPLRGIRTLADWLATSYADMLDEEGKEQIGLLSARVDRMHNLIDGILQYSRVGREKEKQVRVNLNVLISEVIDMVAPPENIEITVENEMPVIECQETCIMQVFQNLLSNAIKYMDKPQGQIRIGCVQENAFWKFRVTDNGHGIEEQYFEKIFQIFQTLSPRDEVESTGVGLSVVKKIVEMYGGKIWVESKPGEGSTFFFTLPKPESEVIDDAKLEANIVS